MQAVYEDYYLKEISGGSKNSYRSTRRYKSVFNSMDCEYKKGDTLKSLTAGNTKEETFVADANDRKQEKSVTAETSQFAGVGDMLYTSPAFPPSHGFPDGLTFDPLCDHREVLFPIVPVHVAWNLVVLSCPFTVVL